LKFRPGALAGIIELRPGPVTQHRMN